VADDREETIDDRKFRETEICSLKSQILNPQS